MLVSDTVNLRGIIRDKSPLVAFFSNQNRWIKINFIFPSTNNIPLNSYAAACPKFIFPRQNCIFHHHPREHLRPQKKLSLNKNHDTQQGLIRNPVTFNLSRSERRRYCKRASTERAHIGMAIQLVLARPGEIYERSLRGMHAQLQQHQRAYAQRWIPDLSAEAAGRSKRWRRI